MTESKCRMLREIGKKTIIKRMKSNIKRLLADSHHPTSAEKYNNCYYLIKNKPYI